MFIKIKLEPKNGDARDSNHDPSFINLSNTATVRNVKEQIESFVTISVDDQVIKNVTRTLEDHEKLCNICDFEGKEGSALMLFDEYDEFVCFLQLYNDAEAAKQRQFEEESKKPCYYKKMSTTSSVTLINDSDDEDSSSESTSSSTSTNSSSETSSAPTNCDAEMKQNKKRTQQHDPDSKPANKRSRLYHSELISRYLDELPNYTEGVISSTTPTNETAPTNGIAIISSPKSASNVKTIENDITTSNLSVLPSTVSKESSNSKLTNAATEIMIEPCASVTPDMRMLIAIVTTDDCQEFLKTCSLEFERSKSASSLQFDDKIPIVLHSDGNLWIACKDNYTLEWVLDNIKSRADVACSIKKLLHHFEYEAYTVVMPKFQRLEKSLHEQFLLLENQNTDLKTGKWVVERQHVIESEKDEFYERNISVLCKNEVLFLQIDQDSVKYLKSNDFQLKYCFWKILFQKRNEE